MKFLEYTRSHLPELADYAKVVAQSPLSFAGEDPLQHSSYDRVSLWTLEYLSDTYNLIESDYRVDFVNYILEQWRRKMKGLPPLQAIDLVCGQRLFDTVLVNKKLPSPEAIYKYAQEGSHPVIFS